MLVVFSTHPVQYHAPVYRELQSRYKIPVTVIYGSNQGIVKYHDREFNASFRWDTDLLQGYESVFLSNGKRGSWLRSAGRLEHALKKLSPKVVLLTGYGCAFHKQAIFYSCKNRYPLLFRAEVNDASRKPRFVTDVIRDTVLRAFYSQCDGLAYIGQRAYEHYKRLGVQDAKLFFSPYCVDLSSFKVDKDGRDAVSSMKRTELGIAKDKFVLIFSGKLISKKQPQLALQALSYLEKDIRNRLHLLFVGDGPLRKSVETDAGEISGVESSFVGFQNQKQLSPYYHCADALVLPSLHGETWGLVVNEALAHGIPAIVSDLVGCAPDLIQAGVTGETFQAGRPESLAEAIARLLKWKSSPGVREQCLLKSKGYSTEAAAEGLARAYRHCLVQAQ